MDLTESDFHRVADAYLENLFEMLEEQDVEGALDIDLQDGVLKILTDSGKTFIINKHGVAKEIWLASPLSGGLHFSPADNGNDWKLSDGRRLSVVISEELSHETGNEFDVATDV